MFIPALQRNPSLLKAAVYGANDGIITTFAVVAGAAGAGLSSQVIIILGVANMIADALSMGLGDYLGEKSERRLQRHTRQQENQGSAWSTGIITFTAFVLAGIIPLLPFLLVFLDVNLVPSARLPVSVLATGIGLFLIGSLRTLVTKDSWLRNGVEMLVVGAIAATAAYVIGHWIETLL